VNTFDVCGTNHARSVRDTHIECVFVSAAMGIWTEADTNLDAGGHERLLHHAHVIVTEG